MKAPIRYLMESEQENQRLDLKTDPESVKRQARLCGIRPGMRVLDAGCGSGKTTAILHEMVQPGGSVVGVDYAAERIRYAEEHYGGKEGLAFYQSDIRSMPDTMGTFDAIWIRFVLEYYRCDSMQMVKKLDQHLKEEGCLCLLDLDNNCLGAYELPDLMEEYLTKIMTEIEKDFNFDPYAGRRLYAYLYDLGYVETTVHLMAHHLIYGEMKDNDAYNWMSTPQQDGLVNFVFALDYVLRDVHDYT